MGDQDEQKIQAVEPLAKFHARIDSTGRIIIPRHVRAIFNIEQMDHVMMDLRHVVVDLKSKEIHIIKVAPGLVLRVGRAGAITIPQSTREQLLLGPGDLVEVILYDIIKMNPPYNLKRFKYVYSPDARV